jgi:hypothetical protein
MAAMRGGVSHLPATTTFKHTLLFASVTGLLLSANKEPGGYRGGWLLSTSRLAFLDGQHRLDVPQGIFHSRKTLSADVVVPRRPTGRHGSLNQLRRRVHCKRTGGRERHDTGRSKRACVCTNTCMGVRARVCVWEGGGAEGDQDAGGTPSRTRSMPCLRQLASRPTNQRPAPGEVTMPGPNGVSDPDIRAGLARPVVAPCPCREVAAEGLVSPSKVLLVLIRTDTEGRFPRGSGWWCAVFAAERALGLFGKPTGPSSSDLPHNKKGMQWKAERSTQQTISRAWALLQPAPPFLPPPPPPKKKKREIL